MIKKHAEMIFPVLMLFLLLLRVVWFLLKHLFRAIGRAMGF